MQQQVGAATFASARAGCLSAIRSRASARRLEQPVSGAFWCLYYERVR